LTETFFSFQIFFLCVILGLFHGLIYLPVILMILGTNKNVGDEDDVQFNGIGNMGFNLNAVTMT
jgi:hypothetical protein